MHAVGNFWFTINCHDCGKWFRFETRDERAAYVRAHQHNNLVMDDIDALKHPHYGDLSPVRVDTSTLPRRPEPSWGMFPTS